MINWIRFKRAAWPGFLGLFICLSNSTKAAGYIAEATMVRGFVTGLGPHQLKPVKIKEKDKLQQETSLVTGKNSFVRVEFYDQSKMNLGPDSMAVIVQAKKEQPTVISLLKGRLRNDVEKKDNPENKNRLYITTRSAAMGVRGTDFQTIYNPENRITSLVTFKGKVAMAKVQKGDPIGKIAKSAKKGKIALVDESELTRTLSSTETVEVQSGQYAGVSRRLRKSSLPVKLSPVQLEALYANQDMKEKKADEVKALEAPKADAKPSETVLEQAEQTAPPEGIYDPKNGDFAPKAGGYVDLNTGIYIAPEADSVFDEKKKVYVPKHMGIVDAETGQYLAPQGVKLDAEKGFVPDLKDGQNKEVLLAMTEEMNTTISQDFVLGSLESISETPVIRVISKRESLTKDNLEFNFRIFSETLKSSGDVNGDKEVSAGGSKSYELTWRVPSHSVWQPYVGFGHSSVEFDELNGATVEQTSSGRFKIESGIRRFSSKRWFQVFAFSVQQQHFLEYNVTSNALSLKKVAIPRFGAALEGLLIESKKWSLETLLGAHYSFSKSAGNFEIENGWGFRGELNWRYWLSGRSWFTMGPWLTMEKQDVSNPAFNAGMDRSQGGFSFILGKSF